MRLIFLASILCIFVKQIVSDGRPCECTNQHMNCAGRKKTTLDPSEICPNVEKAFLSDNLFTLFPNGFFERFTNIDLSFNKLTSLPDTTKLNPHIRILDLRSNTISSTSNEFRTLSNLKDLKLNGNQLTSLGFLPDLCSLRKIEVNYNAITTLNGPLRKCTELEHLDLTGNKLTNLPADSFVGLTKLDNLHLQINPLRQLTLGIFRGLAELDTLLLSETELTSIPAGIFGGLTKLKYLTLSDNPLKVLPSNLFSGLVLLEMLFLNSTQLQSVPVGLFAGLSKLKILHLNYNQLTTLPPGLFDNLPKLEMVMLNRNRIIEVPPGVFTNLPSLEKVFLDSNRLTRLVNLVDCCPVLHIASFDRNLIQEPSEIMIKKYLLDEDRRIRLSLRENTVRAASLHWMLHDAELQRDVDDDNCACGSIRRFRAYAWVCVAEPCGPGQNYVDWIAAVRAAGATGA